MGVRILFVVALGAIVMWGQDVFGKLTATATRPSQSRELTVVYDADRDLPPSSSSWSGVPPRQNSIAAAATSWPDSGRAVVGSPSTVELGAIGKSPWLVGMLIAWWTMAAFWAVRNWIGC